MSLPDVEKVDVRLRAKMMSLCAPIWWEIERQTIVNSGTMCLVKTPADIFGVTSHHVLKIYAKHKEEKHDVFCQLGSAPFDPTKNIISDSWYWDLTTFTIPEQTLKNWGHQVYETVAWPPPLITSDDVVAFGGYYEEGRTPDPGLRPKKLTAEFVSFRRKPHSASDNQFTFHVESASLTWLPGKSIKDGTNLSGISGGPCFRLVPAEHRIELAGFIYEGDWIGDIVVFARQAALISATGHISPAPPGAKPRLE